MAGSPLVGVGNSTTRLFHLLTSSSSHQNQIKPRIGIDSQQDNKLNPIEFLRLAWPWTWVSKVIQIPFPLSKETMISRIA